MIHEFRWVRLTLIVVTVITIWVTGALKWDLWQSIPICASLTVAFHYLVLVPEGVLMKPAWVHWLYLAAAAVYSPTQWKYGMGLPSNIVFLVVLAAIN